MIIHIVILLENNIQGYIGITLSVYLLARLSVSLSVRLFLAMLPGPYLFPRGTMTDFTSYNDWLSPMGVS